MPEIKTLHENIKKYWIMGSIINLAAWIVTAGVLIMVYVLWLGDWDAILYVASIILATRIAYVVYFLTKGINIKYSRYKYKIQEDEIYMEYGTVFNRFTTIIPMNRVQHVDTLEGILLRWYGLVELRVNTAGESYGMQGLTPDVAEKMRRFIIEAAKLEDDDDAYND